MPHLVAHNVVPLTQHNVFDILDHLSGLLYQSFGGRVTLVVHGGIVMVLHQRLACRESTRDIDFCLRSFVSESQKLGIHDAEARLNSCINATAKRFQLGADWMNCHADVALPMSIDQHGNLYDPIYKDAMKPDNVKLNTIYNSPGLTLIGVSWSWAVALKLIRYKKDDPYDIARILTLGCYQRGVKWTRTLLEGWLRTMCAAMNYDTYSFERMEETRQRMRHAISLTQQQLNPSVAMPPLMHHRSVLPVTSHHHASADHKHRTQPHYLHPVPPPPPPPMSVMHPTAPIYLPPKKHSPVLLIPPTSSEAPKRRRYPVRPPTPFHTSTQTLPPIYMQQSHMPALRAF